MNQTRSFLMFAWLFLALMIWRAWEEDHAPKVPVDATTGKSSPSQANGSAVPGAASLVPAATAVPTAGPAAAGTAPAAPPVSLGNDVLRLQLDPRGASVTGAELIAYGETAKRSSPPIKLLDADPASLFVAESGLVSASGHAPSHLSVYQVEGGPVSRNDSVSQSFLWTDPSGLQVRKTYTLHRGSYVIGMREEIRNGGSASWTGNDYRQLRRVPPVIKKTGLGLSNPESYAFAGSAWYSPELKYETRPFAKYEPVDQSVTGGWFAMVQHYFLAAWIPDPKEPAKLSNRTNAACTPPVYCILSEGPAVTVPAGATHAIDTRLYVGPAQQDTLPAVAPGLELTVDYGWFALVAKPIYWLLSKLHLLIGNWGWSIIALVLLLKLAMFKLSEAQYKNMAKMRALAPRMEALKERYGDDKQQYQMAMMELYKKEKVNPAGGCLPMLIPIPIFFALYRVLLYSVELRHAPWVGWIQSLSDPDPYFVLPALNMLVMIVTSRLTPSPGMDPMQKRMMQMMPLVFGVMFAFFPAGLVLYWVTNGSLGLLQQWWLMRRHGAPAGTAAVRKG